MDQPQPQTTAPHQSLSNFTTLVQRAWTDYRANALILSGLVAVPALLFILVGVSIAGGGLLFGASNFFERPIHDISSSVFGGLAITLIASFLAILVAIWTQSSMLFAITHSEVRGNIRATLSGGWHLMAEVFLTGIISGLAIALGFILLVIPGVYLWIAFSFAMIIIAAERHSGSDALKRSMAYVKGYWFDVFWKLLGFTVLWNILTFVVGVIVPDTSANIITTALSVVETPLYILFTYHLYKELKAIKEHNTPAVTA